METITQNTPCAVCSSTEIKLVNGFYYCVECGTQDTTVRETVVSAPELAEGVAVGNRLKVTTKTEKVQMSIEWHTWHAYNFILCGLANEVIALGAEPSFKAKLIWIWTRYLKIYVRKEDYQANMFDKDKKHNTLLQDDDNILIKENDDDSDDDSKHDSKDFDLEKESLGQCTISDDIDEPNEDETNEASMSKITILTLYAMIHAALNLSHSTMHATFLIRNVREGRLSYMSFNKYLPEGWKPQNIRGYLSFRVSSLIRLPHKKLMLLTAKLFKELDLGSPNHPDYRLILDNYIREFCLPKEFKDLVVALMVFAPIEWVFGDKNYDKFPNFEVQVMTYVVVGLKMCFGLDDDYELKLCEAVDKINDSENRLQSYRIGVNEPTDRLFSFNEWILYLEFRKLMISQFYHPMALAYGIYEQHFLVTELLKNRYYERKFRLVSDEITDQLLNSIPIEKDITVVSKDDFPISRTPMTAYTEFILPRIRDPNIRLLLSEDFSKYSLKYACSDLFLELEQGSGNIIKGVKKENKRIVRNAIQSINVQHRYSAKTGSRMVFIKDEDNEDWFDQFPADPQGKQKEKKGKNTKKPKSINRKIQKDKVELERIEELDEESNIFGDRLTNYLNCTEMTSNATIDFDKQCPSPLSHDHEDIVYQFNDQQLASPPKKVARVTGRHFNLDLSGYHPFTFERQEVIKALIAAECDKYKIPIPKHRRPQTTRDPTTKKLDRPQPCPINKGNLIYRQNVSKILEDYQANYEKIMDEANVPCTSTCDEPMQVEDLPEVIPELDEASMSLHANNETSQLIEDDIKITSNDIEILGESSDNAAALRELLYKDIIDDFEECQDIMDLIADKIRSINYTKQAILDELKSKVLKDATSDDKKRIHVTESRNFENLITNDVQKYGYYTRFYPKFSLFWQNFVFEKELHENFSKSLKYILNTCATMTECSSGYLYANVIILEKKIIEKLRDK